MRHWSLRTRLAGVVLVVSMVITASLGLWIPQRMHQQGLAAMERRAESLVALMSGAIVPAMELDDVGAATFLVTHLRATGDVEWAVVLRPDGSDLATMQPERVLRPVPMAQQLKLRYAGDQLIASAPIHGKHGARGTIAIGFSLVTLHQQDREGRRAVLFALITVQVAGVGLAWVMGAMLVAPVLRVIDAARRVADDNLTLDHMGLVASPGWRTSHDETEQLTGAISEMAGQLSRRLEQLALEERRARVAENVAQEASIAKSTFLANMSHELRTPLNAVIGYAEILLEEVADQGPAEYGDDLFRIRTAGAHLLGLINDILDLAKIDAGRVDLSVEVVDLGALVNDVAATVRRMMDRNRNSIEVSAAELGLFRTDGARVRQILYNLLSNAAKFTKDGTVQLRAVRDGDRVEFEVEDSGIGIAPEKIGRLFVPFEQVDASTTRKYGGTGLGLALVRRLTELLGGSVEVRSVVGVGSTFQFTLTEHAARTPAPVLGPGATTVLVVDDDPVSSEVISGTLGEAGYQVLLAADGTSGLASLVQHRPLAVLVGMSVLDTHGGRRLVEVHGADPLLSAIPLVMMSSFDGNARGVELGPAEYLEKPVDRAQLLETVERFRPTARVPRVLIVEDDIDTARVVARVLEKEGWLVAHGNNGRDALQLLDPVPSLVLLDLMMPEMDGFTFVEHLRSDPRYASVPVVVMTARTLSLSERRALEGGVQLILAKGDGPRTLLGELQRAVRAHALERPGDPG